jgi:hypothetical protein
MIAPITIALMIPVMVIRPPPHSGQARRAAPSWIPPPRTRHRLRHRRLEGPEEGAPKRVTERGPAKPPSRPYPAGAAGEERLRQILVEHDADPTEIDKITRALTA